MLFVWVEGSCIHFKKLNSSGIFMGIFMTMKIPYSPVSEVNNFILIKFELSSFDDYYKI